LSDGTPRPIRRSGWEKGGGGHEQECQESTEGGKAASTGQLWLRLPGLVEEALYETVIEAVDEVLEAERVALCGAVTGMWSIARRGVRSVRWCWVEGESRQIGATP